jgi:hypothetical protein
MAPDSCQAGLGEEEEIGPGCHEAGARLGFEEARRQVEEEIKIACVRPGLLGPGCTLQRAVSNYINEHCC